MNYEKTIAKDEESSYNYVKRGAKKSVANTPKDDVIFKLLFGVKENEDLLKDFLEALLEIKIHDLKIDESTLLLPEEYHEKMGTLDVLATLDDGTKVNIEMQNDYYTGLEARAVFYLDKIYLRHIPSGHAYKDFPKAVVIFILNDNHFNNIKNFHSKWYWTHNEHPRITLQNQEMHLIELPKFRKQAPDLTKRLNQWLAFLDYENKEWIKMATEKNEKVKEANEKLDKILADKKAQYIQYLLEKGEMDRAAQVAQSYSAGEKKGLAKGKTEGKIEGISEGKMEVAKNLLKLGLSVEDISKATGLSIEEINKL